MADISEASLYIGKWPVYIRYRDALAPRGYDAKDADIPQNGDLVIADLDRLGVIPKEDLAVEDLGNFLLRIGPQQARKKASPSGVLAMAATPLYKMLVEFLRDHGLQFRVARFIAAEKQNRVLFDIRPNENEPGGRIPDFVIDYFQSLPQCAVLTEIRSEAKRRMLVAHGYNYPLKAESIMDMFPQDNLILFTAGLSFSNLLIHPAPVFFDRDDLGAVYLPVSSALKTEPVSQSDDLPFDIHVRLVPASGPVPATTALILDEKEFDWVRRLFHRMPESVFASCRICAGETQSVLMSEDVPLHDFPFGIPLCRFRGTQLFIPLRSRITPDLSWKLLAKAFNIREDVFTFLFDSSRLDIPKHRFAAVTHALMAEKKRSLIEFGFRKPYAMPELKSDDLFPDTDATDISISKETIPPIIIDHGDGQEIDNNPSNKIQPTSLEGTAPVPVDFRQNAETFQSDGDYINAALCFALAGDALNAAQSYREAAERMVERPS